MVLLRLFQTARQFNMEVQPQLVLLQKTLLAIEGLGRQLYPELDLWTTAKPVLEQWMEDQIGPSALKRRLFSEAPYIVSALPELPRLIHQWLLTKPPSIDDAARELASAQRTRNVLLAVIAVLLVVAIALLFFRPG